MNTRPYRQTKNTHTLSPAETQFNMNFDDFSRHLRAKYRWLKKQLSENSVVWFYAPDDTVVAAYSVDNIALYEDALVYAQTSALDELYNGESQFIDLTTLTLYAFSTAEHKVVEWHDSKEFCHFALSAFGYNIFTEGTV